MTDLEFFNQAREIMGGVSHLMPEVILTITVCLIIIIELLVRQKNSRGVLAGMAVFGLILAFLSAWDMPARGSSQFLGMVSIDSFGAFFKLIFIGSTIVTVVLAVMYEPFRNRRMGEFYAILLCSVIGMCLMASATDLLMFYLSLEMVSIPSYILVVYLKQNPKGSEASLKYAIYGSVASGLMIFGLSLFYGMTGTTEIAAIARAFQTDVTPFTLVVASVLVLGGFAYKMAAVPMHFWCPDVYEGAPTPVTAWLSVASKGAGFAMLIRFLMVSFPAEAARINWPGLIALLSVVTMTYGNLAALWQENVKRMLAYSSIAHAGYMLMGVALYQEAGFPGYKAVAFYFLVYLFMNLGAFAVVIVVENRLKSDRLDGFHGLGYRSPFIGAMMVICLFSLIGVPPTGGFIGKLQIFAAVVDGGYIWLAIAAGLNTAISVWYYFRIIRKMYLDEPDDTSPLGLPLMAKVVVAALVLPVLYLGIFFQHAAKITQGLELFTLR